jgi:predicted MFS family arabinose efflux permease
MEDILDRFQVTASAFGQFSGIYYIGYAFAHLPIGIALDRYGPKKVLSCSIWLCSLGLLSLLAFDWIVPTFGRLLIGIGSSAAILGVFKVLRMSFPEERFTRMLSFSVTIGLIGAIYGGSPLQWMKTELSYTVVVALLSLLGLLLGLATYLLCPQKDQEYERDTYSKVRRVLKSKGILTSCLLAGCMVGPLEGFADVWAKPFLEQVHLIVSTWSSSLPSLIFIGMCLGAPILNGLTEWVGDTRKAIFLAGSLMFTAFVLLLTCVPMSPWLIGSLFMAIGVGSAYQILAIYHISSLAPRDVVGITTALANMVIMCFGYGFHSVIGETISFFGGAENPIALSYGLIVIPLLLAVGAIGFIRSKSTAPILSSAPQDPDDVEAHA